MADTKSANKSTKTETKKTEAANNNGPDEQQLKTVSAVGYLGILFLLPYLMFPKEKFAVFHANQGLSLGITLFAINAIGGAIPILGWFVIIPLGNIFCLVMFITGVVNAMGGKMKRLPVIGGFDILKVQE